jgi:AmmeMemoRadiSam system protein A
MMSMLSDDEKHELLQLARQVIIQVVGGKKPITVNVQEKSEALREPGATFVTITKHGNLRGCIGTLEAYQPLILDVMEHAAAAAMDDYRFSPVRSEELGELELEISVLTQPQKISYSNSEELSRIITPGKDGVVIKDGLRRATFLPQVWEQLPLLDDFMGHLCQKMGASAGYWKKGKLEISLYQVIEFREK